MKTDTFFYKAFQAFPQLLFELIDISPSAEYEFVSVEVKEKGFRFDGIFLPNSQDHPIYFAEVQFQSKFDFYWEYFSEIFLYLNQYRPQNNWGGIIIFPDRSTDPGIFPQGEEFFASGRVFRIYLDQLVPTDSPLVEILRLVVASDQETAVIVAKVIGQTLNAENRTKVIELLTDLLIRKFPQLTREEVQAMFMLTDNDIKKTKFYQEVFQEGIEEGKLRGIEEGKLQGIEEGKVEAKSEMAINLLQVGMSPDQIAMVTGLSIEYVQSLGRQ